MDFLAEPVTALEVTIGTALMVGFWIYVINDIKKGGK